MNYIRLSPALFAFLMIVISCDRPIELDLRQTPSKIVIEGVVTNQPDMQYVKVSRTLDFYSSGKSPRVTDASIQVRDEVGNAITFLHNPENDPELEGYYFPSVSFVGEIGRSYTLEVEIEGEVYEATDRLNSVLSIDSMTYELDLDEFDDPEDSGRYYVMKVYAKEPQDTEDYYLFKFFRNNVVVRGFRNDVYFTDDKALGGTINGVESPMYFALNDTARIQIYSLSRQGFIFYNDFFNLLNSDGGMFSPPPANSRTNLSNGALGYFQASAVESKEVIIKE